MKNLNVIILFCLTIFFSKVEAQYEVKNTYLQNPDSIRTHILKSADFWKKSVDWEDGGFYTEVNQDGTPELTTRKSFVQCSRHAYGFSRAFMVSGNEEYLDYAEHASQFVYDHAWDDVNLGWFFSSDKLGNPAPPYGAGWNPNEGKWSFHQHYDILGITALAEATRDPLHLEWLDMASDVNDDLMWDDNNAGGYFDNAALDWSWKSGKSFTSTVDAVTTWVLSKALLTNAEEDTERLGDVAENIMDNLFASMLEDQVKFGFAESYTNDWDINTTATDGSVGHVIKTAWCLARAFMFFQEDDYIEAAQYMIDDMMDNGGYDYTNGGLYTSYDWSTGNVVHEKDYWMLEQGVTGGLMNYFLAGTDEDRDKNLEMADGSLDFFMNHFIDEVNGEIYSQTDAVGNVINNDKSDPFKGGYHNIEMAYLVYLYGNLFLEQKPVSLYYKFGPETVQRVVKMTPLAIIDDLLSIDNVEVDGVDFTQYESDSRMLTIPANTGGIFKITYNLDEAYVKTENVDEINPLVVYPNPTKDFFSINNIETQADAQIFSLEGRLVKEFNNISDKESLAVSDLIAGTYFLKIKMDGKVYRKALIIQ